MAIPQITDTLVASTMEGERVEMRFDPASTTHLMSLLTEIASDPEAYCLQEYACNARDSHIEAKQTRPIEVTLPVLLEPTLRIKDYGVGLNADGIRNTFSLYGASTKRESNDMVGVMGIGSKSALAYTTQFMVIGVKDGIKTVVNVSKDDEGGGSMTILEEVKTDEPNGVEIAIPTHRHNGFDRKARRFFQYWPEGSVLVDGQEPEKITGLKISDRIFLADQSRYGFEHSVIVMGGYSYTIPEEICPWNQEQDGYRLIAHVDIGDIHFTPSRDALKLTKRTLARVERLGTEITEDLHKVIQNDIETAANPIEALRAIIRWRSALKAQDYAETVLKDLKYQNKEIPEFFQLAYKEGGEDRLAPITTAHNKASTRPGTHNKSMTLPAAVLADKPLVVHGYNAAKFTPSHKKKLVKFAEERGLEVETFILSDNKLDCKWVEASRVVMWATVKDIKLERAERNPAQTQITPKGSYPMVTLSQTTFYEAKAESIDTSTPIYYFTLVEFEEVQRVYRSRMYNKRERTAKNEIQAAQYMLEAGPCTVVRLGRNRVEKFKRDFPAAKPLKPALTEFLNKKLGTLDPEVMEAYRTQQEYRSLRLLKPERVSDPELQRAIRLATLNVDAKVEPFNIFERNRLRSFLPGVKLPNWDGVKVYKFEERYPLIGSSYALRDITKKDHVYIYINAAYQFYKAAERKAA